MWHYNNSEYSISLSCWIDNNRTVGWQQHTDEGLWSNSQVVKTVHIRSKIFTWSHKLKGLFQREYQLPWEGRNWELWNMFDTGMTSCQRKITAALSKSFSQREHFYHTLFSPVDLAFSQGRTSNHCHGDRSTCKLSHCAAPARLKQTTGRRERWRHYLLPQVLGCAAQSGILCRAAPSGLASLGDLVKGKCLVPAPVAEVWRSRTADAFQLFSLGLQGRRNLFLSSVLLKVPYILWS